LRRRPHHPVILLYHGRVQPPSVPRVSYRQVPPWRPRQLVSAIDPKASGLCRAPRVKQFSLVAPQLAIMAWMLLGCGSGVKGRSPRERVAEGEPLRPLPQPSHTAKCHSAAAVVHVAVLVTNSRRAASHVGGFPRPVSCVSVRAPSSAAAPTPQNLTYGRRASS
jgi:hypothetical protein